MRSVSVPVSWAGVYEFACHSAACRPPGSGGTGGSIKNMSMPGRVSHIRGDIQRERKAILRELDAQGLDPMNPLRHIFESWMGNSVLVVRDGAGKVVGGVQYNVDKRGKTLDVTDMRMLNKRHGDGTAAFESMAKIAAENGYELKVYGAVTSAKPFYSKLGANFRQGSSVGHWSTAARDALAAGKPIPGEYDMPYERWVDTLD